MEKQITIKNRVMSICFLFELIIERVITEIFTFIPILTTGSLSSFYER